MRIMIVDDNPLMRQEILKSVVFKTDIVMECPDGECALRSCSDFNPDWILIDIKMKKMNGITASKKIKEILPNVNIAIVTGYDNYSYREAAKLTGIKHYFMKTNLLGIRKAIEDEEGKLK